jgi:lipopolysaccharide heptosyltransferase I
VKILILKPSALGDVVQAMPVLRLLKRHWPESRIHWWIEAGLAPLLADDPDLAGVIPFHRRRWSAPWRWPEVWRHLRDLRSSRFDWIVDLQGLARSGATAWLAMGRHSIGVLDPREGAAMFYDVAVPRPSPHTHAVDWYLQVLRDMGVPADAPFDWIPPRAEAAARIRNRWPVQERPWILLQPGARWLNKRWPLEHFQELARSLGRRFPDYGLAVLGSADEVQSAATIAAAAPGPCLNLAGQLTLSELVEWVRAAAIMVSNDTGPMHLAAALQRPVVAIFGPTDPRRTGPYGQGEHTLRQDLPCSPCLKRVCHFERPLECLRTISPASVAQRVQKRLEAQNA